MDIIIDLKDVVSKKQLLDICSEKLGLPEFFGNNWDAFRDCLSDPDLHGIGDNEVKFINYNMIEEKSPRVFNSFRSAFTSIGVDVFHDSYDFEIRKTWLQSYPFDKFSDWDLKNQEASWREFNEEDIYIETKMKLYSIDFGWYGENGKRSLFGRVTKQVDFDNPIEKKELKTFEEAVEWGKSWVKKLEDMDDSLTPEEKTELISERKKQGK